MAMTATFSPVTGVFSLVGDGAASQRPFGGNDQLAWRRRVDRAAGSAGAEIETALFGGGAFTVTASGGEVRVFRAFLDQPRVEHKPRQRVRGVGEPPHDE